MTTAVESGAQGVRSGPDAPGAERRGDEGAARGRRGGRGRLRGAVVGEVAGDDRADEPAGAAARARGHSGRPRRGQALGVHAYQDRQREPGRSRHPGVGRQPLAPPQRRDPPLRARVDGASRRWCPIAGRGRGSGSGPLHYLLGVRRFRRFMLSPAEERALSARDASAGTAWQTLRDRTLGALSAGFDDGTGEREWPLSELESARRAHPDRDVRRRAQETTTGLFEPVLPVIAHCYDSLVADRLAVDRLRGHDDPMEQANLENQIDAGVVEALLAASEAHVEIAHSVVPPEGGAARPRAARRRRPAGCGRRRAAIAAMGRGPAAGRGHVRGRDPRARRGGREVLLRAPDRRRAEAREAGERGLLPLAQHARAGLRLPQLDRAAARSGHPHARARAWHQLRARLAGADGQLAQAGHRHRGGPVDVRRTASDRTPALDGR